MTSRKEYEGYIKPSNSSVICGVITFMTVCVVSSNVFWGLRHLYPHYDTEHKLINVILTCCGLTIGPILGGAVVYVLWRNDVKHAATFHSLHNGIFNINRVHPRLYSYTLLAPSMFTLIGYLGLALSIVKHPAPIKTYHAFAVIPFGCLSPLTWFLGPVGLISVYSVLYPLLLHLFSPHFATLCLSVFCVLWTTPVHLFFVYKWHIFETQFFFAGYVLILYCRMLINSSVWHKTGGNLFNVFLSDAMSLSIAIWSAIFGYYNIPTHEISAPMICTGLPLMMMAIRPFIRLVKTEAKPVENYLIPELERAKPEKET